MTNLIRKPLFWTNVAAFTITGLVVAGLAFGWTNPSAAPPGGSGAITVNSTTGNVGIGGAPNANKLSVTGDVSWTGSLTSGSVPWARLTSKPSLVTSISAGTGITLSPNPITSIGSVAVDTAAIQSRVTGTCPSGASAIGSITSTGGVTCNAFPAGGVGGSGTAGTITKFTAGTTLGNSAITESGTTDTFAGDIVANSNAWGVQTNATHLGNGGAYAWTSPYPWSLMCPAGYYAVGIGQSGTYNAVIYCAKL